MKSIQTKKQNPKDWSEYSVNVIYYEKVHISPFRGDGQKSPIKNNRFSQYFFANPPTPQKIYQSP